MCGLLRLLILRGALCDRPHPSDSIVHVERCVIASSTRGDFDYCIATWLRVGAVYDLNFRLIKRYRNTFIKTSLAAKDVATRITHVTPVTFCTE